MLRLIIILLSSVSLTSFTQTVPEIETDNLQKFIQTALANRLEIIINQDLINNIYKSERPLTGFDINTINDEAMERFLFGDKAEKFLNHYARDLRSIRIKRYENEHEEVKNTLTAFALAMTLSDNYLLTYSQFNNNKRLRKLLNEKDQAIEKKKNLFRKTVRKFYSLKNRKQFRKAKKIFQEIYLKHKDQFERYPVLKVAENAIIHSYTFQKLIPVKGFAKTKNFFKLIGKNLGLTFKTIGDGVSNFTEKMFYGISKGFGNTAGLFQSRDGLLLNDQNFLDNAYQNLKPLDIILEKTPFRLTDKFIPGYWGHAAIYVGSKQDLIDLGIYYHPHITPYHDKIDQGATIVEALRPGVQFNSLEHFSDIDDFVILRYRKEVSTEQKREYILRAFSQVGKRYDFSFDVESSKTIVCSELHYKVFEDIPFRTTKIIGRYTIDVDQIAEMGVEGEILEPILLYINGEKISLEETQVKFDSLFDSRNNERPVPFLQNKREIEDIFLLAL